MYDEVDQAVLTVLRLRGPRMLAYDDVAKAYRDLIKPALDLAHAYAADLLAMLWYDGVVSVEGSFNGGIYFNDPQDVEGLRLTRAMPPIAGPDTEGQRELKEAFEWYAPRELEREIAHALSSRNGRAVTFRPQYAPTHPRTPKH